VEMCLCQHLKGVLGIVVSILYLYCRFAQYIQEKDEMDQRPIFTDDGYTFAYIKVRHAYAYKIMTLLSRAAQQPFLDVCNKA